MVWLQLYQRLRTQASRLFTPGRAQTVRVIRTEVTVEQEQRLWLIPQTPAHGGSVATAEITANPVSFPQSETRATLALGGSTAQIPNEE